MKVRLVSLVALFVAVLALDAIACGDSLYRVGKGVSYRVYTAPLPGSVLVYGQSEGAKQLAEALAQSGHGVRLVDNEMELTMELETGNYDVVIAPYSEHAAVESNSEVSGSVTTTYLPVALNGDEEEMANQSYSEVMVADKDEIKHYLKAIHKSLKNKTSRIARSPKRRHRGRQCRATSQAGYRRHSFCSAWRLSYCAARHWRRASKRATPA